MITMIILRSFFSQREESVSNRVNGQREEGEKKNEERQGKKKMISWMGNKQ